METKYGICSPALCAPSWGWPGEASGVTHPFSLLTPLILLRVITGWNWSQHCARQLRKGQGQSTTYPIISPSTKEKFWNCGSAKPVCSTTIMTYVGTADEAELTQQSSRWTLTPMLWGNSVKCVTATLFFAPKKYFLLSPGAEIMPWKWQLCDVSPHFLLDERPTNELTNSGLCSSHRA